MARITKEQQVLIDKKLEYVVQRQRAGYAKSPEDYRDRSTKTKPRRVIKNPKT
jgi:hypothetical protein